MNKILIALSIFTVGELISNSLIFSRIHKLFSKVSSSESPPTKILFLPISTFKGVLERFVLFIALLFNLSQILIVFGAIKLGTRLDAKDKVSNDYFIVGNFTSILIAIFYFVLYEKIFVK